jgi:hypothetical protein
VLAATALLATQGANAARTDSARAHTTWAQSEWTNSAQTLSAWTHTARAHSARALKASDSAHLRYVSASGSLLYETGSASGTLPGNMRAHVSIGATISGSFTIYARGGSISGHGAATPKGSGVWESFAGSLTVTRGSGRYTRARGRARLYGTFNRNTYALVVQTVGTLYY